MVGPVLEYIVWLIFSRYSFQKIVSYFSCSNQNFDKQLKGCFQNTENVFNGIVVNKIKNSCTLHQPRYVRVLTWVDLDPTRRLAVRKGRDASAKEEDLWLVPIV